MKILALDLGTQTGWALALVSGSVSFATNRTAGYGIRFLKFRNWLVEMLRKHQVDLVVFEDVRNHAGVFAAHAYGGFLAHLAAVCEEKHVRYCGFGVKTIKKFITGSGNASKQNVIKAIGAKGYKPIDNNEADAIALLLLAESELVKESKGMNSLNRAKYRFVYKKSIGSEGRKVKIRKAKYKDNDSKIFMGPFKYLQITGKVTPAFR